MEEFNSFKVADAYLYGWGKRASFMLDHEWAAKLFKNPADLQHGMRIVPKNPKELEEFNAFFKENAQAAVSCLQKKGKNTRTFTYCLQVLWLKKIVIIRYRTVPKEKLSFVIMK